ncbi:DUF5689 domain-containing protein [Candidatus Eisenbacteria bacterium]|uniref:DUF5689 domain-containing protein n=1 Tax=Eiseniibacteriota bacterium TaxID=2212470 RepID=A0ABV6YNS8_UNCEI
MRAIVLFALVSLFVASVAFAQVPIIDVRNALDATCYPGNLGALVTIEGLVVCGTELGSAGPAFIEDDTAGIGFYFYPQPFLTGDYVTLSAYVDQFNGLLQLADEPGTGTAPTWTILSSGNPVTPHVLTIPEIGEENEGKLVRFECVFFHDAGAVWAGSHTFEDADGNLGTVYIDSSTGMRDGTIPSGLVILTGCHGQYDSTGPDYCDEGYQIMPRGFDDIVEGASSTEGVTWGGVKTMYR